MTPRELLEKHFGFREFLDAQEEIIQAILGGEDTLVIMPTGGGKSLCYQLPALAMEGVTVVVSPLIALMKDQVDALHRRGIAATVINSAVSPAEQSARIRRMAAGEYKLVYIAPERFRHRAFTEALGQATIALFAVDEAHCISQWGHDFRPDYFRLREVVDRLGRPQCAAFTATATPEVRQDILKQLGLREPREFVAGFARPNLRLCVHHVEGEAAKYDRLRALVREQRTGIVYCATRKRVEAVAASLAAGGVRMVAYHGGMTDAEREFAQNQFIARQADVAVATNAFGMGIDRPDIRFVAHFEVPGSLEAYYQEVGRAGRDGEPGVCELYFNFADTKVQDFFIEGGNPNRELILAVYEVLRGAANDQGEVVVPIRDLAARVADGLGVANAGALEMGVSSALSTLHRADYLDRFDVSGERVRGTRLLQPGLTRRDLKLDWAALAEKERRDRAKLKRIVDFVYAAGCRQQAILHYFGEREPHRCGNCDFCAGHADAEQREGTPEEVLTARKALSGVARMKGRYGKGRIIQMLLGSRSREIVEAGLDRLSTHGLLRELGISYLNELFRGLQGAGLVASERRTGFDGKDYQLLVLTPAGEQVMRAQAPCRLSWPEADPAAAAAAAAGGAGRRVSGNRAGGGREGAAGPALALPDLDGRLLEELRKKRGELAASHRVPSYVIFPDATLEALARLKPRTVEAGRRIRGVGEVKAEKFLPGFLAVIQAHEARGEADPDVSPAGPEDDLASSPGPGPRWFEAD